MANLFRDIAISKVLRQHLTGITKKTRNFEAEKPPKSPALTVVARQWLNVYRTSAKRSTCSTYSEILDRHILPAFGCRPVEEISLEELSQFICEKTFANGGTPLSASTVRGIVTVLRAIFRYAGEIGYRVAPWGSIHRPPMRNSEIRVLTEEEQRRLQRYLLKTMAPEQLGVLVCMYTGLRLGEICALKWGDISFDTDLIRIQRTVQRIRNPDHAEDGEDAKTKLIFDLPKSQYSLRSIPIPRFLRDILWEQRRKPDCFLLTGVPGSFLEPRSLQNHFKATPHNRLIKGSV